jgi:hypothetical protein
MSFYSHDHSFCEAAIYGGPPEYINSITSLFISFIGFFGISKNKHSNNDIYLLYGALFLNGFMSFAYHWTNYLGFGLLDRFTMILIAYPAVSSSIKELLFLYPIELFYKKIILVIKQIYFTLLITFCALGYEELFNGLFGLFLVTTLVFMHLVNNKRRTLSFQIYKTIRFGLIGTYMIIFAGILWIVVEKLCFKFPTMKYVQGHAFWHIFVSLGGYLNSLVLASLSIYRKNLLPMYNINSNYIGLKKVS